jgi:hypothetical protein
MLGIQRLICPEVDYRSSPSDRKTNLFLERIDMPRPVQPVPTRKGPFVRSRATVSMVHLETATRFSKLSLESGFSKANTVHEF